jgi:hypothetical protein
MKHLLIRRKELEAQCHELIQRRDLKVKDQRLKYYIESGRMIKQQSAIDQTVQSIQRELIRLLGDAITDLEIVASDNKGQHVSDLAGALRFVCQRVFDPDGFTWQEIREKFEEYEKTNAFAHAYSAVLDQIRRESWDALESYCNDHQIPIPIAAERF